MEVIKHNGDREEFSEKKVLRSMLRTGMPEQEAQIVLERVKAKIHDGITTAKLYHIVRNEMQDGARACFSCRYGIREAILQLGPAGFKFEKYVASILNAMGYDSVLPEHELAGSCVMHEVDVVAEKDGKRHFIEVKFRNEYSDYVDLKNVMATWARFLDLCDAEASGKSTEHFDDPWLVTNANFSDRGEAFGTCKGMRLIGWKTPYEGKNLMRIVDDKKMYPVTVIHNLSDHELAMLSRIGWMLCSELADQDPEDVSRRIEVSKERAEYLVEMAGEVVE